MLDYLVTSRVRRELLRLVWGENRSGNVSELARAAKVNFSAAHRELEAMLGAGLVAASYPIDSHYVSRWMDADRALRFEGGFFSAEIRPWAIPYRSLLPQPGEVTNLLVPVAASASHVAYASLRMEPQYMLMGEAAGQAAALAIVNGPDAVDLHDLDVSALQAALRAHGSMLDNPTGSTVPPTVRDGVTAGE